MDTTLLGFLLLPTDHTSQKEDAIAQRIPVTIWFSIGASFGYLQSRPSPPPKIRGEGTGTRQVAPSRELQNPPLIFDSSEGQRDTLLVCPGPRIRQKPLQPVCLVLTCPSPNQLGQDEVAAVKAKKLAT